jgi:hypothetical protein
MTTPADRSRPEEEIPMTSPEDTIRRLREENARLRDVAEAYERWEADLLGCREAWDTPDGLPRFTQGLQDRWIEIQTMRSKALGRFHHSKDKGDR